MASGAGLGARSLPLRSGPRVTTRPLTTDSGRSATRSYPGRSVPSFALNISHCDLPGGPPWVRTRCHCPRSFFPWKSTRMWPFFRCSESWPGGTESAVPLSQISESPAPYSPPGPSPRARATIRRSSGWPSRRIVARALGDGPGGERSVHLQPDVVVQARGVVLVHHEGGLGVRLHLSRRRLAAGRRCACRTDCALAACAYGRHGSARWVVQLDLYPLVAFPDPHYWRKERRSSLTRS